LAEKGWIVTFGIKPNYPETGYGYIEGEGRVEHDALRVKKFREKPNRETAEEYLEAGNFFWNSGMFVFKASVMKGQFKTLAPEIYHPMASMWEKGRGAVLDDYCLLPNTSIDYAIMEKTDRAAILPSDFGWSDIGSWKSLYDFLPKDDHENVIDGDVMARNVEGCLVMGRERLVAVNSVRNLVVVDTSDSVFVSDMERSKDAKIFVEKLKEKNRGEHRKHNKESHPWGDRRVLESKNGRELSQAVIRPGARLDFLADDVSFRHAVVVEGEGLFVENGLQKPVAAGDSFDLADGGQAALENRGKALLVFYLVQTTKGFPAGPNS
jgi:mannose-1-phosphate guanylyltransferase/mannose-6-phosphate isomerase